MAQQNGKLNHDLPHPTKCAHCTHTFPQALPIVGAPKDTEFLQLCGMIAEHLMRKHPDITRAILQHQAAFGFAVSGIITLGNVETFDEGLVKWRDLARHQLHSFATRNRISDATIEEKVNGLSHYGYNANHYGHGEVPSIHKMLDAGDVIALAKQMRDILEERIGYPIDTQSVILTGSKQ